MLSLQHVTKLYGTVIGVNDVSAELSQGAHGLLGPNGAGKTTLLGLITGQLRPTIGSIKVFGEAPFGNRRILARIGVLSSCRPLRTQCYTTGMGDLPHAIEWF